jgi:hypothetical protein
MASTIRRLLDVREVAEYLGDLTPAALHMQRHRGQEPGSLGFRVNSRILFDPADLEDYIERQKAERNAS